MEIAAQEVIGQEVVGQEVAGQDIIGQEVAEQATGWEEIETTKPQPSRWRWYHGLAVYVAAEVVGYGLGKLAEKAMGNKTTREAQDPFYESLKQPAYAPPGPAFPIVWAVNNTARVSGLIRVLNKPTGAPGRSAYLTLQGTSLLNYASFNAAYFGLRSPRLGAAMTVADLALAVASGYVALAKLEDPKVTASLSTLVPWLVLASAVSVPVALWNEDRFFGAPPRLDAPEGWVKEE